METTVGGKSEIVIDGELAAMQRLAPWVEQLGQSYGLSEDVKFAINLCLEEIVSNVIRHGYSDARAGQVRVLCDATGRDEIVFTVEDDAVPFDPLAASATPLVADQDPAQIGGQGIRLVRGFASSVAYEAIPGGNRMRMGFAVPAGQAGA